MRLHERGKPMFYFSNIIRPLPDELTISYIRRMASANGFQSIPLFLSAFLSKNLKEVINQDCFHLLQELSLCLDEEIPLKQMIADTTLLPAFWPLLSSEKQDLYIHGIVHYPEVLMKRQMTNLMQDLCYCPECCKEDQRTYGTDYLHRIHHLPGIACCPVHHVPLLKCKDDSPINPVLPGSRQESYNRFIISLLNDWIPCSYRELKAAMLKRAAEKTSGSVYSWMLDRLREAGLSGETDITRLAGKMSGNECGLPMLNLFYLLSCLFQDADDLKPFIKHSSDEKNEERLYHKSRSNGYTAGSYDPIFDACGTVFRTSPHAFLSGFRCPVCDKQAGANQLFQKVVRETTDGEYSVQSDYRGINRKVAFKHRKCGNIFSCSAKSFLFYETRCPCEHQYTDKQLHKMVSDAGNYTLLSQDGMEGSAIIRADECGHVFNVRLRKFLKSPYCRTCHPKESSADTFRRKIRDLTGDEYKLTGRYIDRTTPVTIFHTECGREFEMQPMDFLWGQRCPYCKKQYRQKDFRDLVSTLSSGRYRVTDFSAKSMCRILDTETGIKKEYWRSFVVQELMRQTPSKELPHKLINPKDFDFTTADRIMREIRNVYQKNDLISTEGIYMNTMTRKQIGRVMTGQLVKQNRLKHLAPGIYCYPDADTSIINEKLEEIQNAKKKR